MKPNSASHKSSLAAAGRRRFMVLLALPAMCLLALTGHAQTITTAVPGFISYQGQVFDASGNPVGGTTVNGVTTPAPVNRTVTFRVWSDATSTAESSLVYSEQQTATISSGQFSVLVGQGVATTASALFADEANYGPPTLSISSAFGASARYLGVTVSDGTGGVQTEITPRQQIVSSAFAFRAKVAESIGTNGNAALTTVDTGNVGVGNANPTSPLTVSGTNVGTGPSSSQLLITATNATTNGLNEQFRLGVDSGTGSSFLQAYNATGTGTVQSLLLNPNGGNVGIGTTSPGFPLTFAQSVGDKISLWGQSGNSMGLGVQSNLLQIHTDQAASDIAFGYGSSAAFTENLRIKGNGNVGIGTSTVLSGDRLDVKGGNMYLDGLWTTTLGQAYTTTSTVHTVNQKLVMSAYNLNGSAQYSSLQSSNDSGTSCSLVLNPLGGGITIGTSAPTTVSLGINGGIQARGGVPGTNGVNNNGYAFWNSGDSDSGMFSESDGLLEFFTNGSEALRINASQNVGVGTTNPTQGKLVVNGTSGSNTGTYGYLNSSGGTGTSNTATAFSIWASGRVAALEFDAYSDERIKYIRGRSDSAEDLRTLLQIGVTDYTYRDTIEKGTGQQKKVIAQQVEKVFPQAVKKMVGTVPDIYKKAAAKDGWISLSTDLKTGEQVRLVTAREDKVFEVLEVDAKGQKFRTTCKPEDKEVFVYGREVKDFRTVDYEAISMLNVSATQQIKKEKDAEVKALQDENARLREQLAAMEAKNKARDSRLAAIEKLLESPGKSGIHTVSMKKRSDVE